MPILLLGVAHRLADWWQVAGFPGVMVVEDRWFSMGSGFRWAVVFDGQWFSIREAQARGLVPEMPSRRVLSLRRAELVLGRGLEWLVGWLAGVGWRGAGRQYLSTGMRANREAGQPERAGRASKSRSLVSLPGDLIEFAHECHFLLGWPDLNQ